MAYGKKGRCRPSTVVRQERLRQPKSSGYNKKPYNNKNIRCW
jgi:hypothetical protein